MKSSWSDHVGLTRRWQTCFITPCSCLQLGVSGQELPGNPVPILPYAGPEFLPALRRRWNSPPVWILPIRTNQQSEISAASGRHKSVATYFVIVAQRGMRTATFAEAGQREYVNVGSTERSMVDTGLMV